MIIKQSNNVKSELNPVEQNEALFGPLQTPNIEPYLALHDIQRLVHMSLEEEKFWIFKKVNNKT